MQNRAHKERGKCAGVDLNRNFSFKWGGRGGWCRVYHAVWVLRIPSRQQRQHLQRGVPRPGGLQRARVPRGAELRDGAAGQDQALPHLPQLGPDVPLPLGIRQPRGGKVGRPRSMNKTEVSTGCPPILLQVCFLLFCQPKCKSKAVLFFFENFLDDKNNQFRNSK